MMSANATFYSLPQRLWQLRPPPPPPPPLLLLLLLLLLFKYWPYLRGLYTMY